MQAMPPSEFGVCYSKLKTREERVDGGCNPLLAGLVYQAPVSNDADRRYRNDFLTFITLKRSCGFTQG
jgi:hypothetical protein